MGKAEWLVWSVALCVVIAVVSSQNGDLKFNCNRPGARCFQENSTCDRDTGACECQEGFTHYDCRYNESMERECAQTTVCKEGGVCTYNEMADIEMCHCPEQYLEPDCSKNRVSFQCAHDSVKVTIVPAMGNGSFQGLIFVKDQALTDECRLTEADDKPGVFEADLMYDSCGEAYDFVNAENQTTRGFTLMVSYGGDFITALDESVNIYCIFPKSGEDVDASLDAVAKGQEENPIESGSKESSLSPLDVTFLDGEGEEVDPTVPREIGAETNIQFVLNAGDLYTSYRVDQVVAHNGKENPKEINLVEDNCVSKDLSYLVSEFSESEDGTTKNLKYKQFQFLDSEKVVIRYVIRFCKDPMDGMCNKTDCDPMSHLTMPEDLFNAGRRKRRSAEAEEKGGESGVELREREIIIFVRLPDRFGEILKDDGTTFRPVRHIPPPHGTSAHSTDGCGPNLAYLIAVVVLGVLVVVMIGAVVLLLCLRSKQSKKNSGKE